MIHMTSTRLSGNAWSVFCRCGWFALDYETRVSARTAGDQHLVETNGSLPDVARRAHLTLMPGVER
jgi:hypothetical protein